MEIKSHYDDVLNKDRASFKSSNDEPHKYQMVRRNF